MGKRILVVDDEKEIREFIVEVLRDEGHEVELASSGEEGVKKAEQNRVDILLVDVRMDGMNGIQTYVSIKKLNPRLKAVVMTGYFHEGAIQACLHKGVNFYLQKPFDISELLDVISKLEQLE